MSIIKTVLAAAGIVALFCGAAKAQDIRVHGVPTFSHAGQEKYGFVVNGHWYIIPMAGFGYMVQALKVEAAKDSGLPIDFLADMSQILSFHTGNSGPLAHDIDQ